MSLYNHPDFGDVMDHLFAKGTITSVDSDNDLADVTVEGFEDGSDVPLFYHCEPDSEERSNGAIEGAAAAFSEDDEVIVMLEVDGPPVRIVGFVDGIKTCNIGYVLITSGSYITVVGVPSGTVKTDVPLDDTDPENPEYATFPFKRGEDPDITDWIDSLSSWTGWSALFSENTPEATEDDNSTSSSNFTEGGEGNGYWFIRTEASTTDIVEITYYGYELTALNGSDEEISCLVTETETTTGTMSEYQSCGNPNEGAPVGDSVTYSDSTTVITSVTSDAPYFTYSSSGNPTSSSSISTGEDEGCLSAGEINTLVEDARVHSGTSCPFISAGAGQASHYNADAGCIVQLFAGKVVETGGNTWFGYGTSDTGISNVIDTDEEDAIEPSTLSERAALSAALLALIEASEDVSISASFKELAI